VVADTAVSAKATKLGGADADQTLAVTGGASRVNGVFYTKIDVRAMKLGANDIEVSVKEGAQEAAKKTCSVTLTATGVFPDASCLDIPPFPSTAFGKSYITVALPPPKCSSDLCDYKTGTGNAIAVGSDGIPTTQENIYLGERVTIKRQVCVGTQCSTCDYTVSVFDIEPPKCSATTAEISVTVPAPNRVSPTNGKCPPVSGLVEFKPTDNSQTHVDAANQDPTHGSKPAGVITAHLASGAGVNSCRCAEGGATEDFCAAACGADAACAERCKYTVYNDATDASKGGVMCGKQICSFQYKCAGDAAKAPQEFKVSAKITDSANNAATCDVTASLVDKGAPTVANACAAFSAGVYPTDPSKPTFATGELAQSLQRDGFVGDSSLAACKIFNKGTTTEIDANVGIGNSEYTLTCTDAAANEGSCDFTLNVVDRELPVFPIFSDATYKCGALLKPPAGGAGPNFEHGSPSIDLTKITDNVAIKDIDATLNGKAKANEDPALWNFWNQGPNTLNIKVTDTSGNVGNCVVAFVVGNKLSKSPTTVQNLAGDGAQIATQAYKTTQSPTNRKVGGKPGTELQDAGIKPFAADSCRNRCDGNVAKKNVQSYLEFTCSCQADACDNSDTNNKCCDDIAVECKAAAAPPAARCTADLCGKSVTSAGKTCYCDVNCAAKGDCCTDFDFLATCCPADAAEPTCDGKCGSADGQFSCADYKKGQFSMCYCDQTCTTTGDCCADYKDKCP
jgi:hypothetical protein